MKTYTVFLSLLRHTTLLGLVVTTALFGGPFASARAHAADDPLPERNLPRNELLERIRHRMNHPLEQVATPTRPVVATITVPAAPTQATLTPAPEPASDSATPAGTGRDLPPLPSAVADDLASPAAPAADSSDLPRVASGTLVASLPATLENIHEQLAAAMRRLLTNPATLTVRIEPIGPQETAAGKFAKVTVHTANGEVDHLRLATADIVFNQVQLDLFALLGCQRIQTRDLGAVDMDIIITEADLNKFLEFKSKKIKVQRPRIEIKADAITVSGSTQYGLLRASFWATGSFSIQRQDKIYFNPRKFKINSLAVPRPFLKTIVDRINPVLDLAKFPFKLNLKEIRSEPGQLHFISAK